MLHNDYVKKLFQSTFTRFSQSRMNTAPRGLWMEDENPTRERTKNVSRGHKKSNGGDNEHWTQKVAISLRHALSHQKDVTVCPTSLTGHGTLCLIRDIATATHFRPIFNPDYVETFNSESLAVELEEGCRNPDHRQRNETSPWHTYTALAGFFLQFWVSIWEMYFENCIFKIHYMTKIKSKYTAKYRHQNVYEIQR